MNPLLSMLSGGMPMGQEQTIDPRQTLDPRQMMMMQLASNIGNIIGGQRPGASPMQAYFGAMQYNQQAGQRDLENQIRRLQLEKAKSDLTASQGQRALMQRMATTTDPNEKMALMEQVMMLTHPEKIYEIQHRKPDIQSIQEGNRKVTYQINADGTRTKLAEGPMWEPSRALEEARAKMMIWGQDPSHWRDMRNDFHALPEVKQFGGLQTRYKQLQAVTDRGEPMDELAAMYGFISLLDPSSVVRESETGMLVSANSFMNTIKAKIKTINEGGVVGVDALKNIRRTTDLLYKEYYDRYNDLRDEWKGYAEGAGVPAKEVIGPAPNPYDPYNLGDSGLDIPKPKTGSEKPETGSEKKDSHGIPVSLWGTPSDPYAKARTMTERAEGKRARDRASAVGRSNTNKWGFGVDEY